MKRRSFILLVLVVLVNLQVHAQTFVTRNGKLTTIAAEAVSANGAIGAAAGVGRDGKVPIPTAQTQTQPVTSSTGKIWMDRNLGATQVATSSTDAASYGHLYQWGRGADGHQSRTSGTTSALSSTDTPGNSNFIRSHGNWRSPQNDNLWQGASGINNPCPTGYRLPTGAELDAERVAFSSNDAAGAFASPLKFSLAGYRNFSNGALSYEGSDGYYWSSTVSGTNATRWGFRSRDATMGSTSRAYGFSVRCIKD